MTFDEAIEALFQGKLVRRTGWSDPERVAYLTAMPSESGFEVFSAAINQQDSLHDDWEIWGKIQ
jgi:hypothetical protein